MGNATYIAMMINVTILLTLILIILIYFLPIIFIRRFHTANNILTGNVCIAGIICCTYWTTFELLSNFNPMIFDRSPVMCIVAGYLQVPVNCLVIYSLAMITINRFFTVVYPARRLFKRKAWCFISSILQWLVTVVVSIPNFIVFFKGCVYNDAIPSWIYFYSLFIVVVCPSICQIVFNLKIYLFVRSSTRRVYVNAVTTTTTSSVNRHDARDMYLLKHMLFIFIVFLTGWTPVYIVPILSYYGITSTSVLLFSYLLPVISSVIFTLDLFMYNHDLRQYLKEQILKCLHLNRNRV